MDQERKRIVVVSHLRNSTSDLVVDKEQLWIKRSVQQLKGQLRDLELAEILEKETERCRRLTQQKQD